MRASAVARRARAGYTIAAAKPATSRHTLRAPCRPASGRSRASARVRPAPLSRRANANVIALARRAAHEAASVGAPFQAPPPPPNSPCASNESAQRRIGLVYECLLACALPVCCVVAMRVVIVVVCVVSHGLVSRACPIHLELVAKGHRNLVDLCCANYCARSSMPPPIRALPTPS